MDAVRIQDVPTGVMSAKEREEVRVRFNNGCEWCGSRCGHITSESSDSLPQLVPAESVISEDVRVQLSDPRNMERMNAALEA